LGAAGLAATSQQHAEAQLQRFASAGSAELRQRLGDHSRLCVLSRRLRAAGAASASRHPAAGCRRRRRGARTRSCRLLSALHPHDGPCRRCAAPRAPTAARRLPPCRFRVRLPDGCGASALGAQQQRPLCPATSAQRRATAALPNGKPSGRRGRPTQPNARRQDGRRCL
jgi:hypothetical protein